MTRVLNDKWSLMFIAVEEVYYWTSNYDKHCLTVSLPTITARRSCTCDNSACCVQIFRKGLTRMFSDRGEDCVFMETCMNLKRYPHMVVECIPLPKEIGDMAPIYFKVTVCVCLCF